MAGMRARLRAWFRPPRRLRLERGGTVLLVGVFGLGLATLNTGNNVLYLLVGALLGLIVLSGWLSEQTLTGLRITRRLPTACTAGHAARIEYQVANRKRRLPSVALELREADIVNLTVPTAPPAVLSAPGFAGFVLPGTTSAAHAELRFPHRGVYRLERLILATSHPFGLFVKERDLALPTRVLVRPATSRAVPAIRAGGKGAPRAGAAAGAAPGAARGDYRSLRPYRPGDDPRDVHWRSSARRGEPIVREYERDAADTYWIVLDTAAPDVARGEAAVETAAALAAAAAARADRFGFAAGSTVLEPSGAAGQLEAVLDLLAQVQLHPQAPLALPASPAQCVLVTASGAAPAGIAQVVTAVPERSA